MIPTPSYRRGTLGLLLLTLGFPSAPATPEGHQQAREVGRTTERELTVLISSGVGSLIVGRGEPGTIVLAEERRPGTVPMHLEYAVRNRVGYLDLQLGEGEKNSGVSLGDMKGGAWDLRFSDAIPISLEVEQAVGRADFDLTGLLIKDFTLNAGAADVTVRFDKRNEAAIENMTIESGLSKFTGKNLGNANFRRLRFNGGLGSYTLDFNGGLAGEVDVDVELGMGALTVIIPPNLGVRILYDEGWLSKLDTDADIRKVGPEEYASENLTSAAGRINLRVNAGVGSVNVRRR